MEGFPKPRSSNNEYGIGSTRSETLGITTAKGVGTALQKHKTPPKRGFVDTAKNQALASFFSSSSRSSRRRILPTLVVGRLSRNSTNLGRL